MSDSVIPLKRAVNAIQIPSGHSVEIPEGTEVIVTQSLGGSFTVAVHRQAGLFRIQAADADALGLELTPADARPAGAGPLEEEDVWDVLKTCYDPEIPVNIVDLGLIYSLDMKNTPDGAEVQVKMTLTAPGCGMGPAIAADARQKILGLAGIKSAVVDVVWDPPWSPDRISEEGRAKLGMA